MDWAPKLLDMLWAIVLFGAVVAVILGLAALYEKRGGRRVGWWFVAPSLVLVSIGLVYPALRTLWTSFNDASGKKFVGIDNYTAVFTNSDELVVLRNTVLWTLVTPFVATAIGLVYAVLVDKAKGEAVAKAVIFLPMAISLVGASIIWKFMYSYKDPAGGSEKNPTHQIGFLNQVLVWLHLDPVNFLLNSPQNTFWLIVVMIWIQAGFAMTILSASIKAIPDEIVEAARLDGVGAFEMFRFVTLPSIRPAVVVVLTTIAISCLKVFDIVRTMTGGNFNTNVIANEFYSQTFSQDNRGLGAALAVILFILVVPIIVYNVRQLRASEAR
ncbi:carbohydrate ABC transporter permease [Luteimicrobium subarcticum]|uniref:Carbohydrate ABC transporter membrane protein 1 (CUT1 family) n=1 Tax=Luteimicrobium subarcticum TaxID=620910 RepID=A0A2M8W737_9MICO|nr:sugar ABC transporter permease [Luteimicrobium subarcticum]PJI86740.1 carbohydrate ABC transporter membrane protein 1 (CUT1 family) [Luteimicrobium subarcticum]